MSDHQKICRSFAFINYNIPPRYENNFECNYITLGFFDGMKTKLLESKEENGHLKMEALWRYNQELALLLDGTHSFQNVFGIRTGDIEKDQEFWTASGDYPFIAVTFIRLNCRSECETDSSEKRKSDLLEVKHQLEANVTAIIQDICGSTATDIKLEGLCYMSMDKDDLILAVRTNTHSKINQLLMKLHEKHDDILYTYSIHCIGVDILTEIDNPEKNQWLSNLSNNDRVDELTLHGVINTTSTGSLERKAAVFSKALDEALFSGNPVYSSLYDIVGEYDFRYAAKQVPLVNLLRAIAPCRKDEPDTDRKHPLSYGSKLLQAILYYTLLEIDYKRDFNQTASVDNDEIAAILESYNKDQTGRENNTVLCDRLKKMLEADDTKSLLPQSDKDNITFSRGETLSDVIYASTRTSLWKLYSSLRSLERAPARKYEFITLYQPFRYLLEVLFHRDIENLGNEDIRISWYQLKNLSDILQSYSSTLYGLLRTDIRFFQVNDFNAIIHYAPAKLSAFYWAWVSELVKYYSSFPENNNKRYTFIVEPSNTSITRTDELARKDKKNLSVLENGKKYDYRIMRIKLPERFLYLPQNTCVILAHEIAHFGGGDAKQREKRQDAYIQCLSIWVAVMVNSMLVGILNEQAKSDDTALLTRNALFCYLDQKRLKDSLLYCRIKEFFSEEWNTYLKLFPGNELKDKDKHDETLLLGRNSKQIATNVLNSLFDTGYGGSSKSMLSLLLLNLEADFRAYLIENWQNEEWRQYCQGDRIWFWSSVLFDEVLKYFRDAISKQRDRIRTSIQIMLKKKNAPIQDCLMGFLQEPHADMFSILSLKLTPDQYKNTFLLSTLDNDKRTDQYARIWIVAKAMTTLCDNMVEEHGTLEPWLNSWRNWKEQIPLDWKSFENNLNRDSYFKSTSFSDLAGDFSSLLYTQIISCYFCSDIYDQAIRYLVECGKVILKRPPKSSISRLYQELYEGNLEQQAVQIDTFLREFQLSDEN